MTKGTRGTTAIVFALCLIAVVLHVPAPISFVVDSDQGHQLSGARQLLHGEHPFIDFRSTYGPLTFYASALAQIVSGGRPLGELILALAGYAIAYTLLFAILRRVAEPPIVATLWLAVALLTMPRFYKYYVVLGPVVTLWAGWRYREQPTRLRLWLLAAAVTATALYRLDFGLYSGLAAALLVATAPPSDAGRWRRLAVLVLAATVCAAPWLLWAFAQGGLENYVTDSLGSAAHARGMSLPFPRPVLDQGWSVVNAVFVAFVGCFALPATGLLVAVRRRRSRGASMAGVVGAALLGQGTLVQATHRSDVSHLLQAIPVLFVLCAWLTGESLGALRGSGRAERVTGAAGLAGLALLASVLLVVARPYGGWPQATPRQALGYLITYAKPRAAFLDSLAREYPDHPTLRALHYLHTCTTADQRILALPLLMGYYYLADRSFAGGKMLLAPGFFATPADEARMIDVMRGQDVVAVIDQPELALDGDERRRMAVYAPQVSRFLDERYVETQRFGPLRLRLRRDLVPQGPGRGSPCPAGQ